MPELTQFSHLVQVRKGGGSAGPDVDAWLPWGSPKGKPYTRQEVISLAVNKFLKESGYQIKPGLVFEPFEVTAWHYDDNTPTHENGRPRKVHMVTFKITPTPAKS